MNLNKFISKTCLLIGLFAFYSFAQAEIVAYKEGLKRYVSIADYKNNGGQFVAENDAKAYLADWGLGVNLILESDPSDGSPADGDTISMIWKSPRKGKSTFETSITFVVLGYFEDGLPYGCWLRDINSSCDTIEPYYWQNTALVFETFINESDLGFWNYQLKLNGTVIDELDFELLPFKLSELGGNQQTVLPGDNVVLPLTVRLSKPNNDEPVGGKTVNFEIVKQPRAKDKNAISPSLSATSVQTGINDDDRGTASTTLRVGSTPGEYIVEATHQYAPDDKIRFTIVVHDDTNEPIDNNKENGEPDCLEEASNPINILSGNKYEFVADLNVPYPSALEFARTYNSQDDLQNSLGWGWRHSYDRALSFGYSGRKNNQQLTYIAAKREDGKTYSFDLIDGNWLADADVPFSLASTEAGWQIKTFEFTEIYDLDGNLNSISYLDGREIVFTHSANKIIRASDNSGQYYELTYNSAGLITALTHVGETWSYEYDAHNNLTSVTQPDGSSVIYHYEDPRFEHALTGITDQRGVRGSFYTYDSQGRANSSSRADGVDRVDITYNNDKTRTVINSKGEISTYHYRVHLGSAKVTKIEGPGCSSCSLGDTEYRYDSHNNLIEKTVKGVITQYRNYSKHGLPGTITKYVGSAQEKLSSYKYHDNFPNRLTREIHRSNFDSVESRKNKADYYVYNDFGQIIKKRSTGYSSDATDAEEIIRETNYQYAGPLNQLSMIDGPRTDVTDVYHYDYYANVVAEGTNRARLRRVTAPLGMVLFDNIQYADDGKISSYTSQNNIQVMVEYYPGSERVKSMTESNGVLSRKTAWTYLATGEASSVTLGAESLDQMSIFFEYDNARRLVALTDGLGNYRQFDVDTEGNVTAERSYDPSGQLASAINRNFDAKNNLLNWTQANETANYLYDAKGLLTQSIDGNGVVTDYSYNDINQLVSVTRDPGGLGRRIPIVYDTAGNVSEVGNQLFTYQYNDFGDLQLQQSERQAWITDIYTHDEAGNVLTEEEKDASSPYTLFRTSYYTYDALNRLVTVDAEGTDFDVVYEYDSCINGLGRLCAVQNGAVRVEYQYDGLGQIVAHQNISYTYDTVGRISGLQYPSGAQLSYQYDLAGRVNGVQLSGVVTATLASNVEYQPFGRVRSLIFGNGLYYHAELDLANRLTQQILGGLWSREAYQYDANGNLVSLTETDPFGSSYPQYSYDLENQLTHALGEFGERTYVYNDSDELPGIREWYEDGDKQYRRDGFGSHPWVCHKGSDCWILPDTLPIESYWTAENDNPEVLEINKDQLGNRHEKEYWQYNCTPIEGYPGYYSDCTATQHDHWQYTYSPFNQLSEVWLNDVLTVAYQVNPLGQRTQKRYANGSEVNFVYGLSGELLVELDESNQVIKEYFYLERELIAILDYAGSAPALYYVHNDHLGTPQVLTNQSGELVWHASADPFGQTIVNEDVDGDGHTITFNIRFPGQYYDSETQLHYNYYRYYDPQIGEYTTSDPIGLAGGLNLYAYVENNPLTRIDPYGLWSFSFGAYAGVGGAILIGQDPSTGQWFYGGRLGIGLGGGASFDYQGKRPSGDDGSGCGHGTTYGDFINVGVSVGPYQYDPIDAHAGYDTTNGQAYHTGPLNDGGITFGNGTGFEIGGAFGVEVVGH